MKTVILFLAVLMVSVPVVSADDAARIVAEAECRAWATAVARSEQAPPPQITSLNRAELAMAYSVAALNRAAFLARRSELIDACMATRGFKR